MLNVAKNLMSLEEVLAWERASPSVMNTAAASSP